jgi:hypothetical protein
MFSLAIHDDCHANRDPCAPVTEHIRKVIPEISIWEVLDLNPDRRRYTEMGRSPTARRSYHLSLVNILKVIRLYKGV